MKQHPTPLRTPPPNEESLEVDNLSAASEHGGSDAGLILIVTAASQVDAVVFLPSETAKSQVVEASHFEAFVLNARVKLNPMGDSSNHLQILQKKGK